MKNIRDPARKRPLGICMRRGEDHIKVGLEDIWCEDEDLDSIGPVACSCEHCNEHSGLLKCGW